MPLGRTVVLPLASPHSASRLAGFAALVATADGGRVVPMTVLPRDHTSERRDVAEQVLAAAAGAARAIGAKAAVELVTAPKIAVGVAAAASRLEATLVVMGWRGPDARGGVFGRLADAVLADATVPLLIVRPGDAPFTGVVLPAEDAQLRDGGTGSLQLAAEVARRVGAARGVDITVAHSGDPETAVDGRLRAAGAWVHHDIRDLDEAVVATASDGDLVVVPTTTTADGLRRAASLLARIDPGCWVVLAADAGGALPGELTEVVAAAARDRAALVEADAAEEAFLVRVRVRGLGGAVFDAAAVERALSATGDVDHRPSPEGLHADVVVRARGANAAVAAVLTALHEAEEMESADIAYEVEPADS